MAQVITFYSYKGGTGRSLAVANVAWVIASNNRRVLVIDWDLEAPGLHYYFRPFLPDPDLDGYGVQGIIDIVREYAAQAVTPRASDALRDRWFKPLANIARHAIPLTWPSGERVQFGERGGIDFIPAGRQEGQFYADRVNSFEWKRLYSQLNGGAFFDAVKDGFDAYDYVLIDSRTGVSDTSGICTIQMADALVVCFTLNNQSIRGAAAIVSSVAQRRPDMPVFPAPMRVDPFERDKADARRAYARKVFGKTVENLRGKLAWPIFEKYWDEVELPYIANYSYEELLSPFERFSRSTGKILPKIESLARVLTNGYVEILKNEPDEDEKAEITSLYQEIPTFTPVSEPIASGGPRGFRSTMALVIWVIFALAILWVTFDIIRLKQSSQQVLGTLLVAYAKTHVSDVGEAASALAAAANLPVPGEARDIALKLIPQGIPYATVPGMFYSAALSPDGRLLAAISVGPALEMMDSGSKKLLWSHGPVDSKARLQFSPDGTKVAVLSKSTQLFDTRSGGAGPFRTLPPVDGNATSIGFDRDGSRLYLLVEGEKRTYVLTYFILGDVAKAVSQFPDNRSPLASQPSAIALSVDGNLVGRTDATSVTVWTLPGEQRSLQPRAIPHDPPVIRYVFSDSMTKVLLVSATSARIMDLASNSFGEQIRLTEPTEVVALQRNGAAAAFAFSDGSIDLYQVSDLSKPIVLPGKKPPIRDLRFSQDGKLIYALYGPGSGSTGNGNQVGGVSVWRSDLPVAPPSHDWTDVAKYLMVARPCLSAQARQQIYGESLDKASQQFDVCWNSK